MNREEPFWDRLLLELLDGLQGSSGVDAAAEIEDRLRALVRENLESLGALPYALDPIHPRDEIKERLMATARADADPSSEAGSLSFPRVPQPQRSVAPSPRRMLPLAAALAVALVGLSAWQFHQLGDQRRQLGRLARDLESLNVSQTALATAHGELAESRTRLAMATTPGAEYCVLRPTGEAAVSTKARGTLVVAPDRGSWYLRIEGLEPCPDGGTYRLWFITEGGPVPGAAFDVEAAGEGIELSAEGVPSDLRAVSVTLEHEDGGVEPAGPRVLFADQAMRLL